MGQGQGRERRVIDGLQQGFDTDQAVHQITVRDAVQVRQVEAGAEAFALAAQDDQAGAVGHGGGHGGEQIFDQVGPQGIRLVGAVQGDLGRAVLSGDDQGLGHVVVLAVLMQADQFADLRHPVHPFLEGGRGRRSGAG